MSDVDRGQLIPSAAEVYEEFFVPALFGQWGPVLVDAAGIRPGDRVLDVGCGTGVAARAAVAWVGANGHVVGVDPNEAMLAVARRHPQPVTWRQGAAEALPFDDASFDRVLCQFALMFVSDPRVAVDELARVLAPGGTLAAATWAAVEESPGYAAMVGLLDDLFGSTAADALRGPFRLGDAAVVPELLATGLPDVRVTRHDGVARFPSLRPGSTPTSAGGRSPTSSTTPISSACIARLPPPWVSSSSPTDRSASRRRPSSPRRRGGGDAATAQARPQLSRIMRLRTSLAAVSNRMT